MKINYCVKKPSLNTRCICIINVTLLLFLIGCTAYTKANYIQDFSSFVTNAKDNCNKYSEANWSNSDHDYENFAVVQYEKFLPELSFEEKITIGKLKATYTALKVKKGANELFDSAKEMLNKAESLIDSSMKKFNK
jgi:hypothetical protein